MELCHLVSLSTGRQSLRSASHGDLVVSRYRLERSDHRAFAVSGPQFGTHFQSKLDGHRAIYINAFQEEIQNSFIPAVLSPSVDPSNGGLINVLYYY